MDFVRGQNTPYFSRDFDFEKQAPDSWSDPWSNPRGPVRYLVQSGPLRSLFSKR